MMVMMGKNLRQEKKYAENYAKKTTWNFVDVRLGFARWICPVFLVLSWQVTTSVAVYPALFFFIDASSHLCMMVSPSVGLSVVQLACMSITPFPKTLEISEIGIILKYFRVTTAVAQVLPVCPSVSTLYKYQIHSARNSIRPVSQSGRNIALPGRP